MYIRLYLEILDSILSADTKGDTTTFSNDDVIMRVLITCTKILLLSNNNIAVLGIHGTALFFQVLLRKDLRLVKPQQRNYCLI